MELKKAIGRFALIAGIFSVGEAAADTVIHWGAIGGLNSFERQAVTFDPIRIDGFIGVESTGRWLNQVNATGTSSFDLELFLNLDGSWTRFATQRVDAPFGAEIAYGAFTVLPLDLRDTELHGINITISGAGVGRYVGMSDTQFTFATPVPEPEQYAMLLVGLVMLAALRVRKAKRRDSLA